MPNAALSKGNLTANDHVDAQQLSRAGFQLAHHLGLCLRLIYASMQCWFNDVRSNHTHGLSQFISKTPLQDYGFIVDYLCLHQGSQIAAEVLISCI